MPYSLKIEPILEDELSQIEPPLMRVVVADLVGPRRDINKIFTLTKDFVLPVEGIKHLRRVRDTEDGRIECILAGLESANGDDAVSTSGDDQDFISRIEDSLERNGVILKDYRIVQVPARPARTDAQLEACSRIWPTKFAKSEHLIKFIQGSIIDDSERLVIQSITNGLLDYFTNANCKSTSGAVIFRYAKVYGLGLSCSATTRANPTKHSPMIAIDSVARNAGAGHWPAETHSIGHDLLGELQKLLDDKPELADHKMDANFLPYICTNYDIIITEEPCMMCTMGLIQSRIRRLFYLDTKQVANAEDVKFASSCRPVCYPDKAIEEFFIHRDKSINHRFEAWRIKLLTTTS
uniref:tRNA-specific adenosine deaminase-like protein 3 n=1 Tax=Aceria tosichella TaxID=561515 RepID=A0A6G1SGZ1_9ACAR